MTKIKNEDWIAGLKHLALNRVTYYDNSFPSNCGEINPDGSISFDCIGMVKSVINEPDICYKTSPAWYYVTPGQVIPDTTEIGILNLCTNVHWGDFSNVTPGSYLYMDGHAGVFVGEFEDPSGIVNTIECTVSFGGGVVTSYTDRYGNRFNHKGGFQSGAWEGWGELTPYIEYEEKPQPKPEPIVDAKFTYQVMDDINKVWLPNVVNDEDYAGIYGSDVNNVYISCDKGNVKYCVHTWGGDAYESYYSRWLPVVVNRTDFAGDNSPIDAIAIYSDVPCLYRAHLRKSGEWLPWVSSKDCDINDGEYGYAGIIGLPIDATQIKLD